MKFFDVAVIGGGLTGLLTAWLLRREGAGTLLLEAGRLCGGQTAGTTAKLTAQHGLRYRRLTDTLGRDIAQRYARSQLESVAWLRQLVTEEGIDCDFRDCDACLYTTGDPASLDAEYDAGRDLGMDRMVRRFSVTSSPTWPSPLVAPLTNTPSRYSSATDSPSTFGSTEYSTGSPRASVMRWQKSVTSSPLNTSCRLSSGTSWR